MEFRINQQQQEEGSSSGYNNCSPPSLPIRLSAFSKPTLSPSSSLVLSPRSPGVAVASGTPSTQQQQLSRNGTSPFLQTPATAKPTVTDHVFTNSSPALLSPTTTPARASATATAAIAKYKECMKNHAASSGRHVVDGCGEFMAAGEEGTHEALKCAACGCHRSFHRKESSDSRDQQQHQQPQNYIFPNNGASLQQTPSSSRSPVIFSPQSRLQQKQQRTQNVSQAFPPGFAPSPMAFGSNNNINANNNHSVSGGTPTESSSAELNNVSGSGNELGASSPRNRIVPVAADGMRKKRFRTKFTADQKQKMLEFAEGVGWRILRQDEAAVARFCAETGVRRQVLKVWMHNNKNTLRKQYPAEHQLQD